MKTLQSLIWISYPPTVSAETVNHISMISSWKVICASSVNVLLLFWWPLTDLKD